MFAAERDARGKIEIRDPASFGFLIYSIRSWTEVGPGRASISVCE